MAANLVLGGGGGGEIPGQSVCQLQREHPITRVLLTILTGVHCCLAHGLNLHAVDHFQAFCSTCGLVARVTLQSMSCQREKTTFMNLAASSSGRKLQSDLSWAEELAGSPFCTFILFIYCDFFLPHHFVKNALDGLKQ